MCKGKLILVKRKFQIINIKKLLCIKNAAQNTIIYFCVLFFGCVQDKDILSLSYQEVSWNALPLHVQNVYSLHYLVPRVEFDTFATNNKILRTFIEQHKDSLNKNMSELQFFNLDTNNIVADYNPLAMHGFYPTNYVFYLNGVTYFASPQKVSPIFIVYEKKIYLVRFKTGIYNPTNATYVVVNIPS